jgi:putative ABC transport system permease protein
MERLLQDLRYGIRVLAKRPGFTIIAVLALALGIGATTAIFSVVNAVLLRPLPYSEPERLALIWTYFGPDLPQNWVSGPEFIDMKERSETFEDFAAMTWPSLSLTGTGDPEQVQCGAVTANLFPLLGVAPAQGRAFTEEEDKPNAERVVILSHGFWQRRFASDPNILGQAVSLDGQNATVVGIMPPGFGVLPPDAQSPRNIELWVPMALDLKQLNRGNHGFRVVGRVKSGVTLEQAQAEMSAIAEQLDKEFYNFGFGINVVPFHGHVVRNIRLALVILLAAVGVVLLIACANVANLLLTRAVAREKEIAVRIALGAGRWRLIRQLLTESVVLAFIGGVLGLLLAFIGLRALIALAPESLPRIDEAGIDSGVLLFTLATSLLTGIIFGLVPAFQASKTDLNESLKEGARGSGGALRGSRSRSTLVIAEVAMALMLLSGAGLLIRSFIRLQDVKPGFNPENLLTVRLRLPQSRYSDAAQLAPFYQQLIERVRALPGVEAIGAISHLPLSGSYMSGTVTVEEALASDPQNASFEADRRIISPDYFRAMGITLLNGRAFTDQDGQGAPPVAIIDESFARRFWPNQDPVGKRVKLGGGQSPNPWMTIVGVVAHVKHYSLNAAGREFIYYPYLQSPARSMYLAVRASGDPTAITSAVRGEVNSIDPAQPVSEVRSMRGLVYTSMAQQRFNMTLFTIFAVVALILASVGVYGVMSYSVTQRTHEIGLRMALGAQQNQILKMIVRQGLTLVLLGVGIGLIVTVALTMIFTRYISSMLYEVKSTDLTTFAAVAAVLATVAVIASYIPARKATRVDPMIALRYE